MTAHRHTPQRDVAANGPQAPGSSEGMMPAPERHVPSGRRPGLLPTITRRAGLQGLPLLAAGAAGLAHADERRARARGAKHVILVYLLGGPSHIDMFDLKPQAPAEIRGPFRPIDTVVPGIQISEHLPKLAQQADQWTLLRSLTADNNDHPYMAYFTLTGRVSAVPLGANTVLPPTRSDDPHMGAVAAKFLHRLDDIPGYVAIPEVRVRMLTTPVAGGGRAGFLGPRFDPLAINDDPREPLKILEIPADVTAERLSRRREILETLEQSAPQEARIRPGQAGPPSADYTARRSAALTLSRGASHGLFDLSAERAALRERYGLTRFGQSLLLARRLVERGVTFVGVHFNHMSQCDGWDTHANNFSCLQNELLPLLDQSLSALLADLAERGMLDETLVVTLGEFGRTPHINANAGRDHWGACGSVLLAGGGLAGGRVIGASDSTAAYPKQSPFGPADLTASVYDLLGIDPQQTMHDALGRELSLSTGRVIRELRG